MSETSSSCRASVSLYHHRSKVRPAFSRTWKSYLALPLLFTIRQASEPRKLSLLPTALQRHLARAFLLRSGSASFSLEPWSKQKVIAARLYSSKVERGEEKDEIFPVSSGLFEGATTYSAYLHFCCADRCIQKEKNIFFLFVFCCCCCCFFKKKSGCRLNLRMVRTVKDPTPCADSSPDSRHRVWTHQLWGSRGSCTGKMKFCPLFQRETRLYLKESPPSRYLLTYNSFVRKIAHIAQYLGPILRFPEVLRQ